MPLPLQKQYKRVLLFAVLLVLPLSLGACVRPVKLAFCPILYGNKTITVSQSNQQLFVVVPNVQECDYVTIQNTTNESITALLKIFDNNQNLLGKKQIEIQGGESSGPHPEIIDLHGQSVVISINSVFGKKDFDFRVAQAAQ